jgi:hypothetical protein
VRRRIGDHDRGEVARDARRPSLEIGEVDVAVVVAATTTTRMPAICADAGIGAVRRRGDQADVAVRVAAARVVRLDHQQPAYSPCEPALGCSETAS